MNAPFVEYDLKCKAYRWWKIKQRISKKTAKTATTVSITSGQYVRATLGHYSGKFIAIALYLVIALLIVCLLPNWICTPFRIDKLEKVQINCGLDELSSILGSEYRQEEYYEGAPSYYWYYFGDEYLELYDEIAELEVQIKNLQEKGDLDSVEEILTKIEEISNVAENVTTDRIVIRVQEKEDAEGEYSLNSLFYDTQWSLSNKEVKKSIQKAEITKNENDTFTVRCYYTDGSYSLSYEAVQIDEKNQYVWNNQWGDYSYPVG